MINIVDMQKTFVLAWVTKLMQPSYEKWKAFPQYIFSQLGKRLYCFTSNVSSKMFLGSERIQSYFWKQLLMLWLDNKSIFRPTKEKDKDCIDPFENACLWNNRYMMHKGKLLFILDSGNANLLQYVMIPGIMVMLYRSAKSKIKWGTACYVFLNTARHVQPLEHVQHGQVLGQFPTPTPSDVTGCLQPRAIRLRLKAVKVNEPCSVSFWRRELDVKLEKQIWMQAKQCTKRNKITITALENLTQYIPNWNTSQQDGNWNFQ